MSLRLPTCHIRSRSRSAEPARLDVPLFRCLTFFLLRVGRRNDGQKESTGLSLVLFLVFFAKFAAAPKRTLDQLQYNTSCIEERKESE